MPEPLVRRAKTAETFYPTIAAWAAGRWIGLLMGCAPIRLGRVPVSMFIFGPLLAPLAAGLYFAQKVVGVRYRLSDESIDELPAIGDEARESVRLVDIGGAEIAERPGQQFHRAGDLHLLGHDGSRVMSLLGVARPERVKSAILDISASRRRLADMTALVSVRPSVDELKAIAAKEKAAAAAKKKAAAEKAAAEKAAVENAAGENTASENQ